MRAEAIFLLFFLLLLLLLLMLIILVLILTIFFIILWRIDFGHFRRRRRAHCSLQRPQRASRRECAAGED